jgi:hypothetical protein
VRAGTDPLMMSSQDDSSRWNGFGRRAVSEVCSDAGAYCAVFPKVKLYVLPEFPHCLSAQARICQAGLSFSSSTFER